MCRRYGTGPLPTAGASGGRTANRSVAVNHFAGYVQHLELFELLSGALALTFDRTVPVSGALLADRLLPERRVRALVEVKVIDWEGSKRTFGTFSRNFSDSLLTPSDETVIVEARADHCPDEYHFDGVIVGIFFEAQSVDASDELFEPFGNVSLASETHTSAVRPRDSCNTPSVCALSRGLLQSIHGSRPPDSHEIVLYTRISKSDLRVSAPKWPSRDVNSMVPLLARLLSSSSSLCSPNWLRKLLYQTVVNEV